MAYIYVATVIVMILLICFTAATILMIARSTTESIRDKTLELVSVYDELLEAHSLELNDIKREIEQMEVNNAMQKAVPISDTVASETVIGPTSGVSTLEQIGKASYLSTQLAELYQGIRKNFTVDLGSVLDDIPEVLKHTEKGVATSVLELISYETMYAMSFLSPEEQLTCISECLSEEFLPLLRLFAQENERFSSLDFYTFLKDQANAERKKAIIYVSPNVVVEKSHTLDIQVSDAICEGIQVELDYVLYDYAILKKELGWRCQQ